jgi:hypothetical protein
MNGLCKYLQDIQMLNRKQKILGKSPSPKQDSNGINVVTHELVLTKESWEDNIEIEHYDLLDFNAV